MPIESYTLTFKRQTEKAIGCKIPHNDDLIWLAKSVLDKNEHNNLDYGTLVVDEKLDIYIPDWLAKDKGLL